MKILNWGSLKRAQNCFKLVLSTDVMLLIEDAEQRTNGWLWYLVAEKPAEIVGLWETNIYEKCELIPIVLEVVVSK